MTTRRDFIKKTILGTTALSLGGSLHHLNAREYTKIIGANDRIRVAAIGVNARGYALSANFVKQ